MSELALQLIREAKEKKLTKLDLGNCELTEIPEELFELVWLEELTLGDRSWDIYSGDSSNRWKNSKNKLEENAISTIPASIKKLIKLKGLYLSLNKLSNIQPVQSLINLTTLDLWGNEEISDIEPLQFLTNLTVLDLSINQISDIKSLRSLINLTNLNLAENEISDIESLQFLTNLTVLDLETNQISDIKSLQSLINLTNLNLAENEISDIRPLHWLTNLTSLFLDSNQISDIKPLQRLTSLTSLYLRSNEILDIQPMQSLIRLNRLDLRKNRIVDISFLQPLIKLFYLGLSQNKIVDIRAIKNIIELRIPVKWEFDPLSWNYQIVLGDNPLTTPPPEIVKQGNEAILQYFKKVKVFLSYSHKDEFLKEELDKHLFSLTRSNRISVWNDRKIHGGDLWDEKIKEELLEANIVLLLISSDFMASEYIWEVEIKNALARHNNNEAKVIPIFLRPCDFKDMPFEKLQGYPKNAKPVTSFSNQDEAFTEIAKGIRNVVENWSI